MEKLSKKAQRLFDYLIDNWDRRVLIGDICRDCHTTVKTLFTKTYPELFEKGYLIKNKLEEENKNV